MNVMSSWMTQLPSSLLPREFDPKLPMLPRIGDPPIARRGNVVSGMFVSPMRDGQPWLKYTLRLLLPKRLYPMANRCSRLSLMTQFSEARISQLGVFCSWYRLVGLPGGRPYRPATELLRVRHSRFT